MKVFKIRDNQKRQNLSALYAYSFSKAKVYTLFLILVTTFSCNSSDDDTGPIPTNQETELIDLIENQNIITINWTRVNPTDFVSYKVYRYEGHTNEFNNLNTIKFQGELITTITNNQQTTYVDNDVPYNAYVNYMMVTVYENPTIGLFDNFNSLNHLYFERPELVFEVLSAEKLNTGDIQITWEIDTNETFENYRIFSLENQESIESSAVVRENGILLDQITDQNDNELLDSSIYETTKISFSVAKLVNGKYINSKNTISINNPSNIDFRPFASLKNPLKSDEIILFGDQGDVLFFETSSLEKSQRIELNKRIHAPTIGDYNGISSLYIPSENGKVFVYDLMNYSLVEEINLSTDRDIISLIIKEDYLIFLESYITNQFSSLSYLNFNDNLVYRTPGINYRLNTLVNSRDEFFFKLQNSYNGNQNDSSLTRYDLVDDQLEFSSGIDNGSIKSGDVFAVSPNFNYFVSTAYGFHLDLDYNDMSENRLGNYGFEMSFDGFNYIGNQDPYSDIKITTDDKIFLSVKDLKKIMSHQAYTFQNPLQSYDTQGYPLLFELLANNQIIVVSRSTNMFSYFIERISID